MVVKDIETIEKEYFGNHNYMIVPDLICTYYENCDFELVCYFSETHLKEFGQCEFYYMMSLMELGYYERAFGIYKAHKGDWFQRCKQQQIYWKHVVLFALYFRELDVTEHYMEVWDNYYEHELVQLVEYLEENTNADLSRIPLFQNVITRYPIIEYVWTKYDYGKKKELLAFEDMQWKVWDKANQLINNGDKLGIEKVFAGPDYEIFSYKPKQVSASMHIIRDEDTVIIFDCGCEIDGENAKRIPVKDILTELGIEHVDAVFISHAHMDHYGSLNEIKGFESYMSKATFQLIKCVSPDTYLGKTKTVNLYDVIRVHGVEIRFVPNGHIMGSVLFDINWKGKYRMVYTGDFSIENQRTVQGLDIKDILNDNPKRIDVLLTETTYGSKKNMLNQQQYEKIFISLCKKHITYGNKVFIPCFAVGRAQEVALLLAETVEENGWRILIDGMASKVTDFYQSQMDDQHKILNKNISACHTELDYRERIANYEIILSSSGMLKQGSTSAKYIYNLIDQQQVCVMKVGFIHESEHLLQSIIKRKNSNLHYVDLSLSAHIGYNYLVKTMEQLSPDNVIYVHGAGIEMRC